jgi:hypothetical protein
MERTAGAMMVRDDFREFRGEVNAKLDKLNEDRREDVRGLHATLNDLCDPAPAAGGGLT